MALWLGLFLAFGWLLWATLAFVNRWFGVK
jgi:hypothetical protein